MIDETLGIAASAKSTPWRPLVGTSTGPLKDAEINFEWVDGSALMDDSELRYAGLLASHGSRIPSEAVCIVERLARGGNARAQYCMGYWGFQRRSDQVPARSAAVWFARAASQGHVNALVWLGRCVEDGLGLPKDAPTAFALYLIAARCGDREAKYYLGRCFESGVGVEADLGQAVEWYDRAYMHEADRRLLQLGYRRVFQPGSPKATLRHRGTGDVAAMSSVEGVDREPYPPA